MTQSSFFYSSLRIPGKIYELAVRARVFLYSKGIFKIRRLNSPVISVGNLTVGGTGKTPCVAYMAGFLSLSGKKTAIISRGYKRESRGLVEVSDGTILLCSPRRSGDEPFLLAASCPGVRVVVNSDRYSAGRWLESRAKIDVFLLDDGYQHLGLARNLNLVLLDAADRPDDYRMIPAGRLREPLAELRRADAVIITRSDLPFDRRFLENIIRHHARSGIPIFDASQKITGLRRLDGSASQPISPNTFNGKPVAAFAGIARPGRFFDDLLKSGMKIVASREFADHHRYMPHDLTGLFELAHVSGALAIMTTEKDAINLPVEVREQQSIPVYSAMTEFHCHQEEELKSLVLGAII